MEQQMGGVLHPWRLSAEARLGWYGSSSFITLYMGVWDRLLPISLGLLGSPVLVKEEPFVFITWHSHHLIEGKRASECRNTGPGCPDPLHLLRVLARGCLVCCGVL